MAVPTVQHGTPSPRSKIALWTHKLQMALSRPLFAVLLALIAGSIIIMITSPGSLVDRFTSVVAAYQNLYAGSFGNLQSTSYSLVNVTSLIFAGLSVAIAFRAGLFNIGAAGQLTVGAVVAGIIGITLPTWPGWLLIPLMIIASILAGAVWGGIVGLLKAWRGAHEVVTTIMLNWIAFFVAAYLIDGPFQAPRLSEQTIPLPPQATLPSLAVLYNQTLGTFLPQIASPSSYTVDVSLILALLALVVYWFITARTTFGYELRVIGQNPKAARYAGISIKKNIVLTMALSGAFAALAGSLHLMGQAPYQLIGPSFSTDTTGFDAIGVALLGRTTSIGILLAGLLFGGLQQAGPYMELFAHIPGDLVLIIQALVLFSIATEFLPAIQRALPAWARLGRKPSLVPDIIGHTVIDLPAKDEQTLQDMESGSVVDEDMIQPTATPGSQED